MTNPTCLLVTAFLLTSYAHANPHPVSFNAPRSNLTAWTSSSAAIGDFNGDGVLDVAITPDETGLGEVSVYLGKGDGTFHPPVQYPVGLGTTAVVVEDFNGDGKLDLAVADANYYQTSSNVSILLGNGDGTFQPALTFDVQYSPVSIAIGDFNADGKLDLAVTNGNSNTVSVLIGNGNGTFQPQVTYAVGISPNSVAVGDLNEDGKLDLVITNSGSNTLSILSGNGDGTFQPQVTTAVGSTPQGLVVADFNHDGRLDLAIANEGGHVSILLGFGNNTFAAPIYLPGNQPLAITSADLNDDRNVDLVVTLQDDTTEILLGEGDGHFYLDQTVAPGGYAIVVGDFNRDGAPDLLLAPGAQFSILLRDNHANFKPFPAMQSVEVRMRRLLVTSTKTVSLTLLLRTGASSRTR